MKVNFHNSCHSLLLATGLIFLIPQASEATLPKRNARANVVVPAPGVNLVVPTPGPATDRGDTKNIVVVPVSGPTITERGDTKGVDLASAGGAAPGVQRSANSEASEPRISEADLELDNLGVPFAIRGLIFGYDESFSYLKLKREFDELQDQLPLIPDDDEKSVKEVRRIQERLKEIAHRIAMAHLYGDESIETPNIKFGLSALSLAVKLENHRSQAELGIAYLQGKFGLKRDYQEGMKLVREAARHQDYPAMIELRLVEALTWDVYERCELDPSMTWSYGRDFYNSAGGKSKPVTVDAGAVLIQRAAAWGDKNAQAYLESMKREEELRMIIKQRGVPSDSPALPTSPASPGLGLL